MISEWTRKDIEAIYKVIAEANYQNSVKKEKDGDYDPSSGV